MDNDNSDQKRLEALKKLDEKLGIEPEVEHEALKEGVTQLKLEDEVVDAEFADVKPKDETKSGVPPEGGGTDGNGGTSGGGGGGNDGESDKVVSPQEPPRPIVWSRNWQMVSWILLAILGLMLAGSTLWAIVADDWRGVLATALVSFFLATQVKLVQENNELVVNLIGRYFASLRPGLYVMLSPFLVASKKIYMGDTVLVLLADGTEHPEFPGQQYSQVELKNDVVSVTVEIIVRVFDTARAFYLVDGYKMAILKKVESELVTEFGKRGFDEVRDEQGDIESELQKNLRPLFRYWGVHLINVMIRSIELEAESKAALRQRFQAETRKDAEILRGVGEGGRTAAAMKATKLTGEQVIAAQLVTAQMEAIREGENVTLVLNTSGDTMTVPAVVATGKKLIESLDKGERKKG